LSGRQLAQGCFYPLAKADVTLLTRKFGGKVGLGVPFDLSKVLCNSHGMGERDGFESTPDKGSVFNAEY